VKWFRHMTDLHTNPDIHQAISRFGHKAYACFLILEEVYGAFYNDLDESGFLSLSLPYFCRKAFLSKKKVIEILTFFQQKSIISFTLEDDSLRVKIPEFIRLAGSWRIRQVSDDVTPVFSRPAPEEERGKEEGETEEKKNPETFMMRESIAVLNYLNEKTGKNFSDTRLVLDLLRQGRRREDFTRVIDNKLADPFFRKNPKLYNPRTLFGSDRFDLYLNETGTPAPPAETPAPPAVGYYLLKRADVRFVHDHLAGLQAQFRYLLNQYGIVESLSRDGEGFILDELAAVDITAETVTLFAETGFTRYHEALIQKIGECTGLSVVRQYEAPEDFAASPICGEYVRRARKSAG
jgi:uncharacterized phage protein (TIGR02220 family)